MNRETVVEPFNLMRSLADGKIAPEVWRTSDELERIVIKRQIR
jgi:hypothetical protein